MKLTTARVAAAATFLAVGAFFSPTAFADGAPRYREEGNIKVRFYYDRAFYNNGLFQYSNLQTDLINTLKTTGKYRIGMNIFHDTASYTQIVDLGTKKLWSNAEMKTWLDSNLRIETGVVKILIHARGMTPSGACGEDSPGTPDSFVTEGVAYRALPSGERASGHVTITAKSGCSVNSTALKTQSSLKNTFAHEFGHTLAHPGAVSSNSQCRTPPTASIMCHSVANNARRIDPLKWFAADTQLVRTNVFGSARKNPLVACYEWSSYQACDTQCVNGAGFPNIGATEVYQACLRANCDTMCR